MDAAWPKANQITSLKDSGPTTRPVFGPFIDWYPLSLPAGCVDLSNVRLQGVAATTTRVELSELWVTFAL
jgi:hypothetical protein